MKFLLDQGLPRSTVAHLHRLGIVAEHVGDLGLAAASDPSILSIGRDRGRVIVTLDADFHRLLAASRALSPSVIRLRIEGLKGEDVARCILRVLEAAERDLLAGAAATVTERRLAIRRLPLGP